MWDEHRLLAPNHLRHFARTVDLIAEMSEQASNNRQLRGIAMRRLDAANRARLIGDVNGAVVGEPRNAVIRELGEQRIVGHRAGEDPARLGEKMLRVDRAREPIYRARRRIGDVWTSAAIRLNALPSRPISSPVPTTTRSP